MNLIKQQKVSTLLLVSVTLTRDESLLPLTPCRNLSDPTVLATGNCQIASQGCPRSVLVYSHTFSGMIPSSVLGNVSFKPMESRVVPAPSVYF